MRGADKLAVALDVATADEAVALGRLVVPSAGVLKVGLELFVAAGRDAVTRVAELGRPVFLDLKLHDIPETVRRAVRSAADLGVRYLTVHASGGRAMLAAAADEAARAPRPLEILAVTVLTSLDEPDLREAGVGRSMADQTLALAELAWGAGVRGFVASAREVAPLRAALGPSAVLVTPGIRPSGAGAQDQKRTATAASAIADGASLLVVGRPIRDAADPAAAAAAMAREIEAVVA